MLKRSPSGAYLVLIHRRGVPFSTERPPIKGAVLRSIKKPGHGGANVGEVAVWMVEVDDLGELAQLVYGRVRRHRDDPKPLTGPGPAPPCITLEFWNETGTGHYYVVALFGGRRPDPLELWEFSNYRAPLPVRAISAIRRRLLSLWIR